MITQTITAFILSTGIDLGVIEPDSVPPPMAVAADTGSADTGTVGSSDDTGDTDTGSSDTAEEDSGSVENNGSDGTNQDDNTDATDTGGSSDGGKYSASDLAGEKGGCSTVSSAPTHLAWLILGVLAWRRRTS